MTLKLEVGKKYRNRNGEVVEITGLSKHPDYPYASYGDCFTETGNYYKSLKCIDDLIEEVIEEPVKKPLKWAKEAHAWIDGIEVESKFEGIWIKATQNVNPITCPQYEWRIAVPQWRKDLAEKMKAGGVLEHWNGATQDWRQSGYCIDKLLCQDYLKSAHESSYRIKPEPKPDVVEFYVKFPHEKLTLQGADFEWVSEDGKKCRQLKVIWDGEGNLKDAEVLK